ncbi:hypothetical protein TSAR_003494 [Trichomalopsis sarcophagae]|uniref:Uncharacterized protein n=1 Tax=Trichomalopsis sarcophagae TaxID=543379 RepID=A0A232F527_9HYME|nr:hypothetical protein TSAR_003494 [Trichomalopsis sarcophagae]
MLVSFIVNSKFRAKPVQLFQTIKQQSTGAACQMIRRLAALRMAEGRQIDEQDEQLIDRTPYMQEHYIACKEELQRMRNFKVYNDVTLFFIFAASDERLGKLMRNEEFLTSFNSRYVEHQYHIYNDYIAAKFERAEKKLRRISAVESHLSWTTAPISRRGTPRTGRPCLTPSSPAVRPIWYSRC